MAVVELAQLSQAKHISVEDVPDGSQQKRDLHIVILPSVARQRVTPNMRKLLIVLALGGMLSAPAASSVTENLDTPSIALRGDEVKVGDVLQIGELTSKGCLFDVSVVVPGDSRASRTVVTLVPTPDCRLVVSEIRPLSEVVESAVMSKETELLVSEPAAASAYTGSATAEVWSYGCCANKVTQLKLDITWNYDGFTATGTSGTVSTLWSSGLGWVKDGSGGYWNPQVGNPAVAYSSASFHHCGVFSCEWYHTLYARIYAYASGSWECWYDLTGSVEGGWNYVYPC